MSPTVPCSRESHSRRIRLRPPGVLVVLVGLLASTGSLAQDLRRWDRGSVGRLELPGGAPLAVESLAIDVSVVGRLARTEVTQVFRNHTDRVTEGTYTFTLPYGAQISRLAMEVDGKMMEGELVERERARQIYERIVRGHKDPALLEWQGQNRFKTQIFPIPARGTKKVVLAYEQVLPVSGRNIVYRYDLPALVGVKGATAVGRFSIGVSVEGTDVLPSGALTGFEDLTQQDEATRLLRSATEFIPRGPLEIRLPSPRTSTVTAAKVGEASYFHLDWVPQVRASQNKPLAGLVLVIDSSAGIGGRELHHVKKVVEEIRAGLGSTKLKVVHGDISTKTCAGVSSARSKSALARCLKGMTAGGATDLEALLLAGIKTAKKMRGSTGVVIFTDGAASFGQLDGDLIGAAVAKASGKKGPVLHAVAVGHGPDEDWLRSLTAKHGGHTLRLRPDQSPAGMAESVLHRVRVPLVRDVSVEVVSGRVGLSQAGSFNAIAQRPTALFGRMNSKTAVLKISGTLRGRAVTESITVRTTSTAGGPLLSRFWARRQIAEMEGKKTGRAEIVQLSQRFGVMSKYTSFLVLENDDAYQRFNVERRQEKQKLEHAQAQQAAKNLEKSSEDLKDVLQRAEAAPKIHSPSPEAPESKRMMPADEADFADGDDDDMAEMDSDEMEPPTVSRTGSVSGYGAGRSSRSAPRKAKAKKRSKAGRRGWPAPIKVNKEWSSMVKDLVRCLPASGERLFAGIAHQRNFRLSARPAGVTEGQQRCIEKTIMQRRLLSVVHPTRVQVRWRASEGPQALQVRLLPPLPPFAKMTATQQGAELAWLLMTKKTKEADRLHGQLVKGRILNLSDVQAIYAAHAESAARWVEPFDRFAWPLVKSGGEEIIESLVGALVKTKKWGRLERLAAEVNTTQKRKIMILLGAAKKSVAAERVAASMNVSDHSAFQTLFMSTTAWNSAPKEANRAGLKILEQDSAARALPNLVSVVVQAGMQAKAQKETGRRLAKLCAAREIEIALCRQILLTLKPFSAEARAFFVDIDRVELAHLVDRRQLDMGNLEFIRRQVALLERMGKKAEATRVLTELVEFAPHDFEARKRFAVELEQRGDILGACNQYAAAVQLNPSERDAFRTMMRLGRSHKSKMKAIRQCIVDGVSNLPVRRNISLVMTWEDDSADIDLHIHEAGGHHTYFSARESKQGGLLYYDITDGLGPEIYVLGGGAHGTYDVGVIYYSGSRKNVKVRLTLLRNAGSPDETRQEKVIVLPRANSSKEVKAFRFKM